MIANIPSNIEAQYTTESDALMAAFWAVKHAAKITYAEWRGQEKVRAAEYGVMRMTKCTAPGHQRKLMKLFDSADLVTLRKFHGDHPAVLAAIKAAHKRAGITQRTSRGMNGCNALTRATTPRPRLTGISCARCSGRPATRARAGRSRRSGMGISRGRTRTLHRG
jgi:hypothetical protein